MYSLPKLYRLSYNHSSKAQNLQLLEHREVGERVDVEALDRVPLQLDHLQLRALLENLIRNSFDQVPRQVPENIKGWCCNDIFYVFEKVV